MALTFTTGTINAANAAAVGQAAINQIRDDLVAHAAWDLVEEYTPASVMKWYVFKCLAAQSGLPNDFFVVFGLTLSTGKLQAFICEGYNAGTHTASLFPTRASLNTNSNTYAYDAQGRQTSQTFLLSTTEQSSSFNQPNNIGWLPSGVSSKWWLTIDNDGFTVAFNGASNAFLHFGKFEWLGSIANAMPIHAWGNSINGLYHGMTRNPSVASQATGPHFALQLLTNGPGLSGAPGQPLGFAGRLDKNDKLSNLERPVCELGIVTDPDFNASPSTNTSDNIGWVVGKVRRCRYGASMPAGVAFGDAFAHNGTLWVPSIPTDGRIWDTGVAV